MTRSSSAHDTPTAASNLDSVVLCTVLFCLLWLLDNGPLRAAGATIITHGYEPIAGHPAWLGAMGDAIASRAGPSTLVYNLNLGPNTLNYEYGSGLNISSNAEVVIKLYWDEL